MGQFDDVDPSVDLSGFVQPIEALSPQAFAKLCKITQDIREASWDEVEGRGKYTKSYDDAAYQAVAVVGVAPAWAKIISVLLFPGYADVWDWVQAQGVEL